MKVIARKQMTEEEMKVLSQNKKFIGNRWKGRASLLEKQLQYVTDPARRKVLADRVKRQYEHARSLLSK